MERSGLVRSIDLFFFFFFLTDKAAAAAAAAGAAADAVSTATSGPRLGRDRFYLFGPIAEASGGSFRRDARKSFV